MFSLLLYLVNNSEGFFKYEFQILVGNLTSIHREYFNHLSAKRNTHNLKKSVK